MIVRVDHVALSVKDMEQAIAFYRDVMGMEKVFDREFGETMARLIGVEGTQVRIVHMKLGDVIVELFDYHYPKGRRTEARPAAERLWADAHRLHREDFWSVVQHLLDHGVQFLGEPVEMRPGVFVAYFHGAEYEVCEIREIV